MLRRVVARDWASVVSLAGKDDFDFEVLALIERRRGEGDAA